MAVDTLERNLTRQERREIKFYAPLCEKVIHLHGPASSGKSITLLSTAYMLRELFGKMPILDFHPRSEFGPYEYMGPRELVAALEKLGDMIEEGRLRDTMDEEAIGRLLEQELGIHLMNATVGIDEAYRNLRKRHSGKKLVIAYEDFLQIYVHYHLAIIMCSPGNDLGFRAMDQVKLSLTCSYDTRTMRVQAKGRDKDTLEKVTIITPVSKYGQMYNRWNPVAVLRGRKIEIKGL